MSAPADLSRIPLFARLDAAGNEALLALMTRQSVEAGEPVFWFGDRGDTLYIVEDGRAEVTAPDARGGHVRLDTLGPGGVFGELGLIDGGPRSATVRALTDCSLLALPREPFHAFLRQRPDVAIDMLQVLGARLRASTATIRGLPNPNQVIAEAATRWQRVSDVVATVAASHAFTLTHIAWFGTWIGLNAVAAAGWLPAGRTGEPEPAVGAGPHPNGSGLPGQRQGARGDRGDRRAPGAHRAGTHGATHARGA